MAFNLDYEVLALRIPQITHRDDLGPYIPFFIYDANQMIENRLGMTLQRPESGIPSDNPVLISNPNLYLYGSLVGAYEFINELEMADYYMKRFLEEIDYYYITDVSGQAPQPVMGEPWVTT